MSGNIGRAGNLSDAIGAGESVNDNHISEAELLGQLLNELRLVRAQLECITEEKITLEDLIDDN
jgi:hypothetical protein